MCKKIQYLLYDGFGDVFMREWCMCFFCFCSFFQDTETVFNIWYKKWYFLQNYSFYYKTCFKIVFVWQYEMCAWLRKDYIISAALSNKMCVTQIDGPLNVCQIGLKRCFVMHKISRLSKNARILFPFKKLQLKKKYVC